MASDDRDRSREPEYSPRGYGRDVFGGGYSRQEYERAAREGGGGPRGPRGGEARDGYGRDVFGGGYSRDQYERGAYADGGQRYQERGFWDRTADQFRSWFGGGTGQGPRGGGEERGEKGKGTRG